MQKVSDELNGQSVLIRVNPDIARALREEEQGVLRELEKVFAHSVTIKPDVQLHHEQFDVMAV